MKRIPILVDKKYSGHWFDEEKSIRFDSNLHGIEWLSDFHEALYLTKSNTWIWNEFTIGNDGDVDGDTYFKSDENFASKWLTRHKVDIQNYEEVPQTVKDAIEKIVSKMEVGRSLFVPDVLSGTKLQPQIDRNRTMIVTVNGKEYDIKRLANLTDANLTGANLTDANLIRANLRDAKLNHANLNGVIDIHQDSGSLFVPGTVSGELLDTESNLKGKSLGEIAEKDLCLILWNIGYHLLG